MFYIFKVKFHNFSKLIDSLSGYWRKNYVTFNSLKLLSLKTRNKSIKMYDYFLLCIIGKLWMLGFWKILLIQMTDKSIKTVVDHIF